MTEFPIDLRAEQQALEAEVAALEPEIQLMQRKLRLALKKLEAVRHLLATYEKEPWNQTGDAA